LKNENWQDVYYTPLKHGHPIDARIVSVLKKTLHSECHFTTHFPYSVFGNISFLQHVGPLFGEMQRGNKEVGDDHTKNNEKARS
jgi:hypothetical protein